jgi:hypothetical protein
MSLAFVPLRVLPLPLNPPSLFLLLPPVGIKRASNYIV